MSQYLEMSGTFGEHADTPDHADHSPTGDIDLRARLALNDWAGGGDRTAIGKTNLASNRGYMFQINSAGTLRLVWSEDGTSHEATINSSVAPTVSDGDTLWIRVTMDVDDGAGDAEIKFYTSTDDTNDPDAVTWTQLGSTQTKGATTSIFDNTLDLEAGAFNNGGSNRIDGRLYAIAVYIGIDGTLGAHFNADDFTLGDSNNDTAVDATGKTWTLHDTDVEIKADPSAVVTGTAVSGGVLESEIVTGGETLIITLSNDTWDATVGADNAVTTALIAGIDSGGAEAGGWDAEVKGNMVFGDVTRDSDTVVTIVLAAEAAYAITANETITVTVPAAAITGTAEIVATPTFDVTNETPTAAVTGTAVSGGVLESEIVTGGETIILTLTNAQWVATAGDDNAITDAIIAGIDSAQSEAAGWDAEVKGNMVFGDVARTSDTVITVTLAAEAAYVITADETITVTLPDTAILNQDGMVASPTFVVTNEAAGGDVPIMMMLGVG